MPAARTPWRNFVTSKPTNFLLSMEGTTVGAFVQVPGGERIVHLGDLTTMSVAQLTGTQRIGRTIRTHTIRLQRWNGSGVPEVCLHPLAIAHLFITEQILRGDIMALLEAADTPASRRTALVDRPRDPSDFSRQLGVTRFHVTLASTFDVAVRPANG